MSAGDVRFEAVGLNGHSYNTSKPRPISAIFSRTLSCSAWAPSHVSLTPSVTQAQRGGEVRVRMCGRLDSSRDKRLNGSHTWLSGDTFVASELFRSNFLGQFEWICLDAPSAFWTPVRGSSITTAITADCFICTWNLEASCTSGRLPHWIASLFWLHFL